jgi:hypothetical protein
MNIWRDICHGSCWFLECDKILKKISTFHHQPASHIHVKKHHNKSLAAVISAAPQQRLTGHKICHQKLNFSPKCDRDCFRANSAKLSNNGCRVESDFHCAHCAVLPSQQFQAVDTLTKIIALLLLLLLLLLLPRKESLGRAHWIFEGCRGTFQTIALLQRDEDTPPCRSRG